MGSRKYIILSSMALFLIFQETKGSAPGNKTGNSTVTTTTDAISIVVAVGTGTIITVALAFVLLFCCRLRSTKAGRTRMDSTPDGNELVSARPSHRRRRAQGVSTAHSSTVAVVSMHRYPESFLTQQQQMEPDAESTNDHIYGNLSSPVLQDRWTWGQRLSRAVRRFLPLTATDPREVSSHISELDEWDIYSDSSVDAVYANCTDLIQSSNIK